MPHLLVGMLAVTGCAVNDDLDYEGSLYNGAGSGTGAPPPMPSNAHWATNDGKTCFYVDGTKVPKSEVQAVANGQKDPLQWCSHDVNRDTIVDNNDVLAYDSVCGPMTLASAPNCAVGAFGLNTTSTAGSASAKPGGCNHRSFPNAIGTSQTATENGACIDLNNAFFTAFNPGNGRSCGTCHKITDGWTISKDTANYLFDHSNGNNPLFRLNDGANSPNACVASGGCPTVAQKRVAYSQLLKYGNIRVGIGLPANADFTLVSVNDPYGFASAAEFSMFRRPMPSSNIKYLSAVMWDTRESVGPHVGYNPNGTDPQPAVDPNDPATTLLNQLWLAGNNDWQRFAINIRGLFNQSNAATVGHAQGPVLTTAQRNAVVSLEVNKFSAQNHDQGAGPLYQPLYGAYGGPEPLATTNYWAPAANSDSTQYFAGINDPLGFNPTGAPFNTLVFQNYSSSAWAGTNPSRLSIQRGQNLFNNLNGSFTIVISDVGGINGPFDPQPGAPGALPNNIGGACTTCHDSPNLGHHSFPKQHALCASGFTCNGGLEIGLVSAPTVTTRPNVVNADFPTYTFRRTIDGRTITVTDPGRALISGKFEDMGKFKGPILRTLASRAPYMHNGSLATLKDVIAFYVGGCFTPAGVQVTRTNDTNTCPTGSAWKARFQVTNNGTPIIPSRQQVDDLTRFLGAL
ncbi:MAG: hypothetical protein H0V17_19985 [Deltaproteobacteria bacterium]|nr:hypothetical protein [Deltaproteobacteria bacterium]